MSVPILTLTEAAVARVKTLLETRGKPSHGIRIGIRAKGCNGLSYSLEFADTLEEYDETVEAQGVKVFIDPKAVMFILGSSMDYKEDTLSSGFVFTNPNEKGRCGCGESFRV